LAITPALDSLIQYKNRRVHIVGAAGTEGFAILEFLLKRGFENITAHDLSEGNAFKKAFIASHVAMPISRRNQALERLLNAPVTFCTGENYLRSIERADLIFATQNWFAHKENAPLLHAWMQGMPVFFLTQLYFALSRVPIIGVTGTNGKTTVTNCIAHLFRTAGIPCLSSGNDRYQEQVLDRLDTLPETGFLVLEISNRQLMELHQGPDIAVLTNIRPDHLDEHGSFEAYRELKASLFKQTPKNGWSVLNTEDKSFEYIYPELQSRCAGYGFNAPDQPFFSGRVNNDFIILDASGHSHLLFNQKDIQLPGKHNQLNCLAAATAAFLAGVPADKIRLGIQSFPGVRHRIEYLDDINDVVYFDDEGSTNPQATCAALKAMDRPVVLIVGGDIKGNADDYCILSDMIKQTVRHIICLPGDAGKQVAANAGDIPVHRTGTLNDAMQTADRLLTPGDALLLSPAGAGFHSRFNSGYRGYRRLVRDRRRLANTIDRQRSISDNRRL
jgi:UDP-N-acetylmuramoylalanine--D-glutamate ligase